MSSRMSRSKVSEKSVRAEEARFRARLRSVLLVGLAGPVGLSACSPGDDTDVGGIDAAPSIDATITEGEGGAAADVGADVAFVDPCAPVRLDAAMFGNDGACDNYVRLPCGYPADAAELNCNPIVDLCNSVCPSRDFFQCALPSITCVDGSVLPDADVVVECGLCLGNLGRRPSGLIEPRAKRGRSAVGDYFARAAYLEAASVDAFRELASRLEALGAPVRLMARAARAAEDEKRHARTTARIARRHGAEPELPRASKSAPVTLEALARENAVEGCVRESFAALVAMHQAAHAEDPEVARAMRVIARDEARHAALAWSIHAWATRRLGARGRARVRAEEASAIARLRVDARSPRGAEVVRLAGVPSAAREAQLAEAFVGAFFSKEPRESGADAARRRRRRRRLRPA